MSWSVDDLLKHKMRDSLLGLVNSKKQEQATEKSKDIPESTPPAVNDNQIVFVVMGEPMGKPRMTRRDVWKKRPVVLRYRDYCDRIREAAPNHVSKVDVYAISVVAYLPVPDSWSKKKKAEYIGEPHRTKPDWDNIGKAVCDALFKEDSMIADGRTRKFWCAKGEERTEVKIWFIP